jgi:hypothetical protein
VSERLDRFGRPVGEAILGVTEAIIEAEEAKLKVEVFEGGERIAACARWLVPALEKYADADILAWVLDDDPPRDELDRLMVEASFAALANLAGLMFVATE